MSSMPTSGFGPSSGYSSTGFRGGNLDGRNNTFRYPSAWWDAAHMELPTTVRHLFKWCRYHALVNPLVSSVVRKMATYPITKLLIDEPERDGFDRHRDRWEDFLFRTANIQRLQIEIGLDYHTYGNCLISLRFPFHKYLECPICGFKDRIKKLKFRQQWDVRNFDYVLNCPKCGQSGVARVHDHWYRSYRDIRVIRWNPADIILDYNPLTQDPEYAYRIPPKVRARVLKKDRRYLEEIPQVFFKALKHDQPVRLVADNLFHFRAPTPSLESNDEGWGYPPILPALKDSFYLQVLKKANEAIMLEHLIPLDILFPASSDQAANPWMMVNLSDWKRRIEAEIQKWRWDPNYKPILPLPVGYQRVGGNGRSIMPVQEIRAWSEHIIAGMDVPQEFVFGGLSWTGSSVSLRMLENQFLNYRNLQEHFLKHFLVPKVARFMGWREVSLHMREFKMADDMQMKQLLLSMNGMRKISDQTLLAEFGRDALEELKLIEGELRRGLEVAKLDQLYKAAIQGEAQQVLTKFQIEAQKKMQAAQQELQQEAMAQGGPQPGMDANAPQGQPGIAGQPVAGAHSAAAHQPMATTNVVEMAEAYARRLVGMEPGEREAVLQRMAQQTPQLHQMVLSEMSKQQALAQQPLPEQRPPRRSISPI